MSFQKDFLSKKITDPLAKIVYDLGKEEYAANFQTQNIDTLNVQILSIKTKTKTLSKDKFHISVKSYDPDQRFYNAVYPDRNKLKLWIKGENSDKLHDYSLLQNNAHLWSSIQVAEQYQRDEPNNMAGHEIVSYANGTHYIHVADDPKLRISDLIVNEPSANGFTIVTRFNPLTKGNNNQDSRILSQKTDSSQNRYGHSINIDEQGNVYFYVKYNYRQYFCKLDAPITIPTFQANYSPVSYRSKNYKTYNEYLIDEAVNVSYDLICKFNYSTKECSIKVLLNDEIIASASSLSGTTALPSNLQIHLPLQEGKWSETKTLPNNLPMAQVYDSSSNQHIATINKPTSIYWQDDNTMTHIYTGISDTDGANITIPNHTSFNNFTEFTIAFWYETAGSIALANRINMFGYDNTPHIKIHRQEDDDIEFRVVTNADGTGGQGIILPTKVNNYFNWNFIVCRWKSGEAPQISINNGAFTSAGGTVTGAINSPTRPFTLYDWRKDNASLLNYMFFNRKLTDAEVTRIYNYGGHLAQFPKNLEPQRLPNPSPPPVTNPVSTIYDLPALPAPVWGNGDYIWLNNPSGQNPFVQKYFCADGVASGIAEETIYNIAAGTGGTTTNPFVTIYDLPKPGSPSTGAIDDEAGEWGYVQYVRTTGSTFYNKKPSEIQLWLNGLGNPTGGTAYLGIIKANGTYITFGTGIDVTTIPDTWTSYTKQLTTNTYALQVGDGVGVIWLNPGSGDVNIHRGGTGNHYEDSALSCQNGIRNGVEWKTPNPDYSMAGVIKTGGDTTGTSPYGLLRSAAGYVYQYGEIFPTGSPMVGQIPTYAAFRVYRDSAAVNGQVSIRHVKCSWFCCW